jgi:hypothetical protein
MRRLFSFLLTVYVIGIAVQIAPLVEDQWDTVPAAKLVASVADELPNAAAWPARAYDTVRGRG